MNQDKYIKRNISMPVDLFDQIAERAKAEGRSVSNMIARLCQLEIKKAYPDSSEPAMPLAEKPTPGKTYTPRGAAPATNETPAEKPTVPDLQK
jgi:hypothetical protein